MDAIYDQQAVENLVPLPWLDHRWVSEWAAFGLAEMSEYLARHLAFARYCEERDGRDV